jgi:hypothetical protein
VTVPYTALYQKYWQEHMTKTPLIFEFEFRSTGWPGKVIVKGNALEGITRRRFRPNRKCAGNFFHWASIEDLLSDSYIQQRIEVTMVTCWRNLPSGHSDLLITCPLHIGWESTCTILNRPAEDFEPYAPSRSASMLRVRPESSIGPAPKTDLLTIVYEFHAYNQTPRLLIHSLYPGVRMGSLRGDISRREGRAFFHPDHPGAD